MVVRNAAWVACLLLCAGAAKAQAKKSFRDSRYGIFLEYPSLWSPGSALRLEPPPALLDNAEPPRRALLRVGFGPGDRAFAPYRDSTLAGVEFSALVVEADSAQTCHARLEISGFRSGSTIENGVSYGWTLRTEESAGRTTTQKVYAAFRQRRCYLYEEDIHESIAPNEGGRALTDDERNGLMHELEDVMASVLYLGGLAK